MTQTEINRAVARVTGESLRTVCGRGFSLADPDFVDYDPEPTDETSAIEDRIVDWDRLDARRRGSLVPTLA